MQMGGPVQCYRRRRSGPTKKVLLFCKQGANRTGAAACALLMLLTGRSVSDVLAYLQQLRSIVYISDGPHHAKHKGRTAFRVLSGIAGGKDWVTPLREHSRGLALPDTCCLVAQYSTIQ
jgi:hypothetical protein